MVFDSVPYAQDYTVIVVYRPVPGQEATLWQLSLGDSLVRGLTTERILSDSIAIRYAGQTDGGPAISTLRQSWPADLTGGHPTAGAADSTRPYVRLAVGGSGGLEVAEVRYYAGRLGNAALRRVQGLLAVRYGITLGPVDYLDGAGHHLWDYADSGLYHHRVAGVGIDTLTGLCQLRSRSEMDGAVLAIAADSLDGGAFLMAGDDDAPLAFVQDGDIGLLGRSWKVQCTKTEGRRFTLAFDTRVMDEPGDSLVLLVGSQGIGPDGTHVYLPVHAGGDSVVFSGVEFPPGCSQFTLARGGDFWRRSNGTKGAGGGGVASGSEGMRPDGGAQGRFSARLYPNPTGGHYALEVEGAGRVQVTIHNAQGVVMASYTSEGREQHLFEGELPPGNVYYATVSTVGGSQTMKLVVK